MSTNRSKTNHLVIHCSATRAVQDVGVKEITRWHREMGFATIGYHFVIRRNGKLETGRPADAIGAHVQGHNHDSIGICLVGGLNNKTFKPENNYTPQQWDTLRKLLTGLLKKYPKAKVLGHRDFAGVQKACPCFPAKTWARQNKFPT
jgi:N-acetylmuramoyl-L-alanine amidase